MATKKSKNQPNKQSENREIGKADKDPANRRCGVFHHPDPIDGSFSGKQVARRDAQQSI